METFEFVMQTLWALKLWVAAAVLLGFVLTRFDQPYDHENH